MKRRETDVTVVTWRCFEDVPNTSLVSFRDGITPGYGDPQRIPEGDEPELPLRDV